MLYHNWWYCNMSFLLYLHLIQYNVIFQRCVSKKVDESIFFRLVQYFAVVLFECNESEDYVPAKTLMNMCFTFYHECKYLYVHLRRVLRYIRLMSTLLCLMYETKSVLKASCRIYPNKCSIGINFLDFRNKLFCFLHITLRFQ